MRGDEIRKAFIDYFLSKEHKHVRSSSLVPYNDPTILFTNAGMNQFKNYFLGNEVPEFTRAVTSQKVMRAGGKHNDLENVGRTDRHHTFFEMLGNFSFGDYFKVEAIEYAWEFLTKTLGIEEDKLAVSVFVEDDEAYGLWRDKIGLPEDKIARMGEKDNFWSMGDTGPCGPCSEIHFRIAELDRGQSPKDSVEADDGKYLEIWNLVFMQYDRDADGNLNPLPKPSIDTGMGLERIASVVQGFTNNYDTDLLRPLVESAAQKAGHKPGTHAEKDVSCRVIADHIRACVFLIADGVTPSNEGRGYVLRRIIRRAARHGKELGLDPGFFASLVDDFLPMMKDHYPEIGEGQNLIRSLLSQEEKRFSSTLGLGMKILGDLLDEAQGKNQTTISGKELFKLYDTYGFPYDLARDIIEDKGLEFDEPGFAKEMEDQRQRARSAQNQRGTDLSLKPVYQEISRKGLKSRFVGYDQSEIRTKLMVVIKDGQKTQKVEPGDEVEVMLAETPFYAESGGQVGSRGEIVHDEFFLHVFDTQAPVEGLILCRAKVLSTTDNQEITFGQDPVTAKIDLEKQQATRNNHTATHLLQAALRIVLGDHVKQSGSLVNEDKLRFDFSHFEPVTKEQLLDVEEIVNRNIQKNEKVSSEEMPYQQAVDMGAIAIFGEKYGDHVRVVQAGESSTELCGGTHCSASGDIGFFKILQEESISAGIRRIEAVTGMKAVKWAQEKLGVLERIAKRHKVSLSKIESRLLQFEEQSKEKDQKIDKLSKQIQESKKENLKQDVMNFNGFQALMKKVDEDTDPRQLAFSIQKEAELGVALLAKQTGADKISVTLVSMESALPFKLNAGDWIRQNASLIDGKGGGKPDFAQCGGTNPKGWDEMTKRLKEYLEVQGKEA